MCVGHRLMMDASPGRRACALCLSCHVLLLKSRPCVKSAPTKRPRTSQSTCSSFFCLWRSHWNRSALLPRQHERGCPLPALLPLIFGAKDGHCSLRRHENIDWPLSPLPLMTLSTRSTGR